MKSAPARNKTNSDESTLHERSIAIDRKLPKADWLKSDYQDEVWEITDNRMLSKNTYKIGLMSLFLIRRDRVKYAA